MTISEQAFVVADIIHDSWIERNVHARPGFDFEQEREEMFEALDNATQDFKTDLATTAMFKFRAGQIVDISDVEEDNQNEHIGNIIADIQCWNEQHDKTAETCAFVEFAADVLLVAMSSIYAQAEEQLWVDDEVEADDEDEVDDEVEPPP